MTFLYQLSLTLHIIAFTVLAGITLADLITFSVFWKILSADRGKALTIKEATNKFPVLLRFSGLLVIAAGIAMVAITHGAFGELFWFKLKMIAVLLILLNVAFVGVPNGKKLQKLLDENGSDNALLSIKKKLNLFHTMQITLFVIIFILMAFRFN